MLCIPEGEKHTRVSEESIRERKDILPVSRDGEGKVEKETLDLGSSGAPP